MIEVFETRSVQSLTENTFTCTVDGVTTICDADWQSEAELTVTLRYVSGSDTAVHPAAWPDIEESNEDINYWLLTA